MTDAQNTARSWSQVLEALHSAIIDELIERRPDIKPTLGMPIRQAACAAPSAALTQALFCEASIGGSGGLALLAWSDGFEKTLGASSQDLWKNLLRRAQVEFTRRGVCPAFKAPRALTGEVLLPAGVAKPSRVIWFPFELEGAWCFLGVGM